MQAALASFAFHSVDAEKGEGIEMAKTHGVTGYPTFIVFNGSGEVVSRWTGYSKGDFLPRAHATAADPATIEEREARYESDPTAVDAATLSAYWESKGEIHRAVDLLGRAQELNEDPETDYRLTILQSIVVGLGDGFTIDDVVPAADAVFASEFYGDADLLGAAELMEHAAARAETPETATPYIKTAVARSASSTDETAVAVRTRLLPAYALRVENDPAAAVVHKKTAMGEGWMDDSRRLNAFAWWCFENRINLEEARTLAERGVEQADPGSEKAMVLDTLAEICNELGDCGDSVELMRRAVAESPETAYYKTQLDRFEKLLAEQTEE
jgi:tetratricopeptide (TPR) repeat protein